MKKLEAGCIYSPDLQKSRDSSFRLYAQGKPEMRGEKRSRTKSKEGFWEGSRGRGLRIGKEIKQLSKGQEKKFGLPSDQARWKQ